MLKTSDMKSNSIKRYTWFALPAIILMTCCIPYGSFAAGAPVPSEMSKPMAQVLLLIIIVLALMIALLTNVVSGAAQLFMQKIIELKKVSTSEKATKIVGIILICFVSTSVFAADSPEIAQAVEPNLGGLSPISFYALISVIGLELVILLALLYNLKLLLAREVVSVLEEEVVKQKASFNFNQWWDKFNSFRPIQEETNIDLGHDYDGIRELDNRLPPWWLYGFYLCIIFGVIYIWRYSVSHSAPSNQEEFQIAMKIASEEKEAYLKKSANKVDENTVVYLSDASSLEAGKKIFATTCLACHLADGGGLVGPNLTDDYWIHGGGMKDIFKTIKYGWPEKGMKSWQEDYSPVQIAQVASYIKFLKGTKPAKPKEPQGDYYEDKPTVTPTTDSTKIAVDKKPTASNY